MITYKRGGPLAIPFRWSRYDQARPFAADHDISEIQGRISNLVGPISKREARIRVEQSGVPVLALVSPADLQQLERLDREKAAHWEALAAIGAAFADVPLEELEAEITRILTEGPQTDDGELERKLA